MIDAVGLPAACSLDDYPEELRMLGQDSAAAVLAWHLNSTAYALRWDERRQSMPSDTEIGDRAAKIVAACRNLRDLVLDEAGNIFDGLGSGGLHAFASIENGGEGREAVNEALEQVRKLEGWANSLAARKRSRKPVPVKRGRKKDQAWHDLIERLSAVYFHVWQVRPGFSRDPVTAAPRGPFFRFVEAVAGKLLPHAKSPEAIASALGKHRWPQWD